MAAKPSTRAAYAHWQTLSTRWADNDAYGHLNNVVYYALFDTAVNNWLLEMGLLDIQSGDPIGVVVASSCRYASPISYPAKIDVGIAAVRIGTTSITFGIGIFASDSHEASAEGQFTHVYVDRTLRTPVKIPPEWHGRLGTLQLT